MNFLVIGAGFGAQHASWIMQTGTHHKVDLAYHDDSNRAAQLREKLGLIQIGSDPEAMIMNGSYDLIVIATPPETHLNLVRAASTSNAKVVVDKPVAHTMEASAEIARLAALHSKPVYTFFQWRLHPLVSKIIAFIDEQRLGDITHFELEFSHDFLASIATDWPWRHTAQRAAAGALADLGIHLFDLLRYISRQNWRVESAVAGVAHPTRLAGTVQIICDADDFAEIELSARESSQTARISVSRVSLGVRQLSVRVFGKKAILAALVNPESGASRFIFREIDGTAQDEQALPNEFNPYLHLLDLQGAGGTGSMPKIASIADGIAAQELMLESCKLSNSHSKNLSLEE